MKINQIVSQSNSYEELKKIANNAQVETTIFGCKYMHVPGQRGTLTMDSIAKRVMELVNFNQKFTETERIQAKELSIRVHRLYNEGDRKIRNRNFITRIIAHLRDYNHSSLSSRVCPLFCSNVRWAWVESDIYNMSFTFDKRFEYYTKQQFIQRFNREPIGRRNWKFNSVDLWVEHDSNNPCEDRFSTYYYT